MLKVSNYEVAFHTDCTCILQYIKFGIIYRSTLFHIRSTSTVTRKMEIHI